MHIRNMKPDRKRSNQLIHRNPLTTKFEPFSTTQVLHSDKQVTSHDEVEFGVKYRLHNLKSESYVIFEREFLDNNATIRLIDETGRNHYLADLGLIPYDNGNWNSTNWLEVLD